MAMFSKVGREINKMFVYAMFPVVVVWGFNHDVFRNFVLFPLFKRFLTKDEYSKLMISCHIEEEEEKE